MSRFWPSALGCMGTFAVFSVLIYAAIDPPSKDTWRLIGLVSGFSVIVGAAVLVVNLIRVMKRDH